MVCKPTSPGPSNAPSSPAAAIIVWPGPGHLLPRRAAPLAPGGSPRSPRPPCSPLCMRQHGRLLGGRRGGKDAKTSPNPRQGPGPELQSEKTGDGTQNRFLANKKPPPGPPPSSSAHHFVPVFPSRFHTIPVHPALFSIPLLSLRLRAQTCSFFQGPGEGSRKPFLGGGGRPGEDPSPHLPTAAGGVQPRGTQPREQYPSSRHAYSIWHPFACTPQAGAAASLTDNKR